jgi:phosphoribosyl-AMP cyclohydrolase
VGKEMMKVSIEEAEKFVERLWFRHTDSTVIAVLQDAKTKEVLMVGHMNREAVIRTLTTGYVHFWSLSRKKLWLKGETSGNYQIVEGINVDCDGDALIIFVKSLGPVCHTGNKSCFYRNYTDFVKDVNGKKEL